MATDARAAVVPEATGLEAGTKSNPLLPLAVVGKRIGQSTKTVRRLLQREEFPNVQWSGGKLCVPEQDVLSYLRRQRARAVRLAQ
jgi:predicted site-specific integrase-resolvase